jgi:hypothetical protein
LHKKIENETDKLTNKKKKEGSLPIGALSSSSMLIGDVDILIAKHGSSVVLNFAQNKSSKKTKLI